MIELDASQVLTFPQVFKAREVVRRGFLSNLLFANVAGIFRYSEHVKEILDKLPTAKQGKIKTGRVPRAPVTRRPSPTRTGTSRSTSRPSSTRRSQSSANPSGRSSRLPPVDASTPAQHGCDEDRQGRHCAGAHQAQELQESYGLTAKQVERDTKATEAKVKSRGRAGLCRAQDRPAAP